MQSEQETLLGNHDQGSRDQPWKYLQDFALRRLLSGLPSEKPLVLWSSAGGGLQQCLPSAFSTAHSVPGKVTRGTSGKKGNIVVVVIGRGGGSGETTDKYYLHVALGSFPCARDSLLCSCTILLHRLLQAVLGPY